MASWIIDEKKSIVTRDSIVTALKSIGITKGSTVIVHTKMSALGYVCGGEVAIIEALLQTVTKEGNLVMPTQSADLSEPLYWENPSVPDEWCNKIRESMPPYDPKKTPCYGLGRTPELFRKFPGVVRSSHPMLSFAAWGKNAADIIENHSLSFALFEDSPIQKLQNYNADIVMIGTNYETTTSLHFAEYFGLHPIVITQGSPIIENGKRKWVTYKEIPFNSETFNEIGKEFEKTGTVKVAKLGESFVKKVNQRELLDFAIRWYQNRN